MFGWVPSGLGGQTAMCELEPPGFGGQTAIFESPSLENGGHTATFENPSEPKLNRDFSLFIFRRNHTSIIIVISHLFICYVDCNKTK
jgi:hypothetical protein